MAVRITRAPGALGAAGAVAAAGGAGGAAGLASAVGRGAGLGFVSRDWEDLFRPLHGDLVNKDPVELKPPYRVRRRCGPEDAGEDIYPMGVLCVKARLSGERFPIDAIVRGEYMKWAVVESLSTALSRLCKVRVRPDQVLFAADDIEILDVQMPYLGEHLWQFADFRFDFKVAVHTQEQARKLIDNVFFRMVDMEDEFCKALEWQYRNIYHLTILGLSNKQHLLMDGLTLTNELHLFKAAQRADLPELKRLIQQGVDVNARQKPARFLPQLLDEELRFLYVTLGRTALLGAAEEGHVQAMRILLEAQADVNFRDASGFHALYLAAGATETAVNLLLAWGAPVGLTNHQGFTPLHNACGSGEPGAIRALLAARADPGSRSKCGAGPVHTAVINDQSASLEVLRACRANLDLPAFGGNTPVHEGVMQNNPAIIQTLFDLGADINIESGPENNFATPLQMATERKKKKTLKKLQELGALERIEHEYDDTDEGELQLARAEFVPRVKGRLEY